MATSGWGIFALYDCSANFQNLRINEILKGYSLGDYQIPSTPVDQSKNAVASGLGIPADTQMKDTRPSWSSSFLSRHAYQIH